MELEVGGKPERKCDKYVRWVNEDLIALLTAHNIEIPEDLGKEVIG